MTSRVPGGRLLFHGSPADFTRFRVARKAVVAGDAAGEAPIFFTPNFATAARCGPLVYVARLSCARTFHGEDLYRPGVRAGWPLWPSLEEQLTELGMRLLRRVEGLFPDSDPEQVMAYVGTSAWDALEANWMKAWLRAEGFDSFIVTGDGDDNVAVFDPGQVELVDKVVAEGAPGSLLPCYAGYRRVASYGDPAPVAPEAPPARTPR